MKDEKSLSPEISAELRVKHLEMLQGAIARMATYSATIKNYCITTVMAIGAFAITEKSPAIASIAALPIIIFAVLDCQYLRNERRFRAIFDRVRKEDWKTVTAFEMNPKTGSNGAFLATLVSWSILIFYLPVSACVLILALFAGGHK